MNTCRPAIQTISPLSTTLKLKILDSVLFTVLKFLFSLVLKYFWLRFIVERSRDTLSIDSSSAEVCSGGVVCFEGRSAEGPSPSTCKSRVYQHEGKAQGRRIVLSSRQGSYCNLKVHHFLSIRAHFIVKAELIFSRLLCGEDCVNLSLFAVVHYDIVARTSDAVVNIEGATRLHLH